MKRNLVLLLVLAVAGAASATTVTYGWEDGGTILGSYSAITATNDTTLSHSGNASLKLVDGGASGTPQAFVAWVTGLSEGDQVTASFWMYDTTPSGSPSGRIWGHYSDGDDIDSYVTSASGNYDYPAGDGWSKLSYTWTIAEGQEALVIEARTYSGLGDTVWVDDLTVTAPSCATITVPEPATMALLGLGALVMRRKKQQ